MADNLVAEVWDLVGEWLDLPTAAELTGADVTRLRQWIREGKLIAVRAGEGEPLRVPAAFVVESGVLKGLPGVITLLRDARYSDVEALRWLFTPDDSLPGTPVAALQANRGTEVKRRAQALGF